jgi:hypothetical protein
MYREVTVTSNPWSGGAPPRGRSCETICRAASQQAFYDSRCEGTFTQRVVLICVTTDISDCQPDLDAAGTVIGCKGTAKSIRTEIHTDMPCPWEPPAGGGGLATAFRTALRDVKKLEEEAEKALKKAK